MEDDVLPDEGEDLEADLGAAPPGVKHCSQCTILIGPGYVEAEAYTHADARGYVCWRCYESLDRRRDRRLKAEALGQPPASDYPVRRMPRR